MNKKHFALIVLVILIAQPLVITSSIALDGLLINLEENEAVIMSQDFGTRLSPEEHTNHVPIVINSTTDFTLQSWPGDGTSGNPFVISGLNITYNHPDYLIKITNTDAYFIIEDCYLGQLSQESGILLENVTHGVIRYVTLISGGGGAYFENADGSVIDHVYVDAGKYYGLYINYSPHFELMDSFIDSITSAAVWVNSSDSSTFSNTIFDSAIPYTDLSIRYSDYVSVLDAEFHASSIELYVYNCSSFFGDGLVATQGNEGIWLFECEDSEIRNADITSEYNALFLLDSYNISISDSTFSNTQGSQAMNLVSCSEILFDQILVNDTNNIGIQITTSDNVTISDSDFTNIPGECIWLTTTSDSNIISNYFENIGDTTVGVVTGSHRANVSYNTVTGITGDGFYSANSDNGTMSYNSISGGVSYGIYLQQSYNWRVHDNTVDSALIGIELSSDSHTDVWNNKITMCENGIKATSHNVMELWENTISECAEGIYLVTSDDAYVRDNQITDCDTGIYLESITNGEYSSNIISDCFGIGIELSGVVNATFNGNNISRCGEAGIDYQGGDYNYYINNNLLECGFLLLAGPPAGYQMYNQSFSGNTVNGKPVYYGINQTGIVLNGSMYGQIIFVYSTDISITKGDFVETTCGIQLMYVNEITMSGINYADQFIAAYALVCNNVTFEDSSFSGSSDGSGIFLWHAGDSAVDNCTFSGIGGSWFGQPSGIFVAGFNNISITDCSFTDLDDTCIILNPGMAPGTLGFVTGNTFDNCTYGLFGDSVDDIVVEGNEFMWNLYGIAAWNCHDWNVSWNDIQENEFGVYRDQSEDWRFTNNTIRWNMIGVIHEELSTWGVIADNIIALNFEANGMDNTFGFWDNGVDSGNYWDDWDGTGSYVVSGVGAAEDRWPMHYVVTEPIINSPQDIYYAEGSEGNEIVWLPHDNFLRDWTVTIDGGAWAAGAWNFENITVNIDGLAYGTHTIFITVWDVDNNYVNNTVIVHVFDDTPPEITGPVDHVLYIDADMTINWDVSDLHPTDYSVSVDDVEFDTGTWTSGILSVDFAGLATGEHNITITVYDVDGNMASDLVVVLVIDDDVDPTVDHPDDVMYTVGTTGNVVVWTPEDDHPDSYSVSSNGTVVETGDWSGSRISVNVDGLAVGASEFSITVYDTGGNSATDTVNVTVLPLIQEPYVPMIDWTLLIIVGAVVGAVIVVIALVYYLKKKKGAAE